MQFFNIKKLSELIDISQDLINTFKESLLKSTAMVKSEILSNPKLYYLIGNNSIKFLEDMLDNESRIILHSMEADSFNFLNKNLSRLYSICIKRGFQEELFKIEFISWNVSLPANMIRYGEEIKKLYSFIYSNFSKILSHIDLMPSKYSLPEEYDDFIRNFIARLFEGDFTEAEILIKTFLVDEENKEKVYTHIFYPSIYNIKNLYETGFFDEAESNMAFSVLNKTLSSIYVEKNIEKRIKSFSIYVPTENIIGEKIINFYHRIEAQIFSDILSWYGIDSLTLNAKEIVNQNFQYEPCFVIFWGVSPFNLNNFRNFAEMVRAKSSNCRIIIFAEDLENVKNLSNYGDLVFNINEALEVIKNA
ncbi:MAG: hypothetical protein N2647_03310 [Thermodesulfovibrio sp.]|nr:hypothetical protein [Thermodesulfovibrio sp.]